MLKKIAKKFNIQLKIILKYWVITTIKLLILIIIAKRKMQAIKIKIVITRMITNSKATRIRLFKIIV